MLRVLCLDRDDTGLGPMMQTILRDYVDELGIKNISVESAGINKKSVGQPIAEFAAKELAERNLSLERHVSRHIGDVLDLPGLSHVLAVGKAEADGLLELCPSLAERITIFEIEDPSQQGEEERRQCAFAVEAEVRTFAADKLL